MTAIMVSSHVRPRAVEPGAHSLERGANFGGSFLQSQRVCLLIKLPPLICFHFCPRNCAGPSVAGEPFFHQAVPPVEVIHARSKSRRLTSPQGTITGARHA